MEEMTAEEETHSSQCDASGNQMEMKTTPPEFSISLDSHDAVSLCDRWPYRAVFAGDIDTDTQPVDSQHMVQRMEAPLSSQGKWRSRRGERGEN